MLVGCSSFCEGDSSVLAWFFCRQATQKGLDGSSPLHFLDNFGRKEIGSFFRISLFQLIG